MSEVTLIMLHFAHLAVAARSQTARAKIGLFQCSDYSLDHHHSVLDGCCKAVSNCLLPGWYRHTCLLCSNRRLSTGVSAQRAKQPVKENVSMACRT